MMFVGLKSPSAMPDGGAKNVSVDSDGAGVDCAAAPAGAARAMKSSSVAARGMAIRSARPLDDRLAAVAVPEDQLHEPLPGANQLVRVPLPKR